MKILSHGSKSTTPYEVAKQIVEAINRPHIFTLEDTHQAVYLSMQNECALTAKGLVLDYQNGVVSANYGGGLIVCNIPIEKEMTHLPFNPAINDAVKFAYDNLNTLFKPTSQFTQFETFKHLVAPLGFTHRIALTEEYQYRFMLLDYFAIVQENKAGLMPDRVFYLTRAEAINIIDTAITLPYQNF